MVKIWSVYSLGHGMTDRLTGVLISMLVARQLSEC